MRWRRRRTPPPPTGPPCPIHGYSCHPDDRAAFFAARQGELDKFDRDVQRIKDGTFVRPER